jgi:hypothetical protein
MTHLLACGTCPNFAAPGPEISGKPPSIRAHLLLKPALLFILPANVATDTTRPIKTISGGATGSFPAVHVIIRSAMFGRTLRQPSE